MAERRVQDFRNLKVWDKAHKLALASYRVTSGFPTSEQFGLTNQIRRCASSIPSNIAEGCGRGSNESARFCRIAFGSLSELHYQVILVSDLQFIDQSTSQAWIAQIEEVRRMLSAFLATLKESE